VNQLTVAVLTSRCTVQSTGTLAIGLCRPLCPSGFREGGTLERHQLLRSEADGGEDTSHTAQTHEGVRERPTSASQECHH